MKKIIASLLMFLFFFIGGCAANNKMSHESYSIAEGVDQLSAELIESTDIKKAGKIAVLYFHGPHGKITTLGENLTDKLSVRLFQSGSFPDMMERRQLKQVLQAKNDELSDFFNSNSVHKFGQMLGVDSVIIGTIEDFGTTLEITTKVISSETGKIMGIADISVHKDKFMQTCLVPLTVSLAIQTRPQASGTIIVGAQKVNLQNGFGILKGLSYGNCQLIINAQGYDTISKSVSIYSPHESLTVPLTEKKFTVSFQVIPPDATLRVDGNALTLENDGYAQVKDIALCKHDYCASAEGYTSESSQFNPVNATLIKIDLTSKDPYNAVKDSLFKKHLEIKNNKAFEVDLWTDKKTFRLGDPIEFNFRSDKDCYLNIVDINSKGEVTLLFPNRFHQDNYIRAGRTYRIPDETYGFRLEVQPPLGRERIYAIASYYPMNIFDTDFSADAFRELTRGVTPECSVRGIGVKINDAPLEASDELVIDVRP